MVIYAVIRKTKNTFAKEEEKLAITTIHFRDDDLKQFTGIKSSFLNTKWNNGLNINTIDDKIYILTQKDGDGELVFEDFKNTKRAVVLNMSIRTISRLANNIQDIKNNKSLISGFYKFD